MNTQTDQFTVDNYIIFKQKMLNWANQFNIFCFLDSNAADQQCSYFESMLAVGCVNSIIFNTNDNFTALHHFHINNPTWLFGHLGYNAAGNAYTNTQKNNNEFENGFFFEPQIVLKITNNTVQILKTNLPTSTIENQINATVLQPANEYHPIKVSAQITKSQYLQQISLLQQHIQLGDCYEINFCQQFMAHDVDINPVEKYLQLCQLSPTPFAALYKVNEHFCLCASPERFMQKQGNTLISQPIKGTTKRNFDDPLIDEANKNYLVQNQKERSENVMVVDLVRNDLSMVCQKASVIVTELCKVYSFAQVHQMISTVQGTISTNKNFAEALQACYPMGSMTGAPKPKVMQLIEQTEASRRGLFSGSIGYISPAADFDFNVVIRSLFYNDEAKKIHFFAGSGITFYSNAESEYEECLTKISAIMQVLNGYF